ncbi:type VI secretion system amidase effector protein Tae4 [Teredinibacter haidensis]|uniref:type VI secretion system amidase effector protein Tae4 n=1 Tax=Teredinibacter haidensis TaxID=2731755 RepID=UPI000948E5F1|nr:type VI secretion system amidase effector protein Tae4 [Teredinibacter haidensis]
MPSFETLWRRYPDKDKIKAICTNKQRDSNKPFSDYCAIMMSECFIRSGVDLSLYKGNRCWSHSGKKHVLLAEDFANGLSKFNPPVFSNVTKIPPGSFQTQLEGKTGVIFFKDYWQRGKESFERRSGDHIDLWNKDRITSSSMFVRGVLEFFGRVSDLNKSREIWFWEVK